MAKNGKKAKPALSLNRALVSLLCIILIISSTLYCSSSSSSYQESFEPLPSQAVNVLGMLVLIIFLIVYYIFAGVFYVGKGAVNIVKTRMRSRNAGEEIILTDTDEEPSSMTTPDAADE